MKHNKNNFYIKDGINPSITISLVLLVGLPSVLALGYWLGTDLSFPNAFDQGFNEGFTNGTAYSNQNYTQGYLDGKAKSAQICFTSIDDLSVLWRYNESFVNETLLVNSTINIMLIKFPFLNDMSNLFKTLRTWYANESGLSTIENYPEINEDLFGKPSMDEMWNLAINIDENGHFEKNVTLAGDSLGTYMIMGLGYTIENTTILAEFWDFWSYPPYEPDSTHTFTSNGDGVGDIIGEPMMLMGIQQMIEGHPEENSTIVDVLTNSINMIQLIADTACIEATGGSVFNIKFGNLTYNQNETIFEIGVDYRGELPTTMDLYRENVQYNYFEIMGSG